MSTAGTILNEAQRRLHDPNATIWSRRELLDYLNEGQREMAVKVGIIQFAGFDSPGRWGYGATFPWELEHLRPARAWLPMMQRSTSREACAYRWEVEYLDGGTPTDSGTCVTQPWETLYALADRPLPFCLPEDHLRTIRPSWAYRRLAGASVRDLDALRYPWWTHLGLPRWVWADGLGTKQIGIYPIGSSYVESFVYVRPALGVPRQYTSDASPARTYSFGSQQPNPLGFIGFATDGDAPNAPPPAWRFTLKATDSSKSFCTQQWEKDQLEGAPIGTGAIRGTATWEDAFGAVNIPIAFLVGTARRFSGSVDYLVRGGQYGTARAWASWSEGLGLIYARIPLPLGIESQSPDDIPSRLHKYLRSYVIAQALAHQGPGQNVPLSQAYTAHYLLGLRILKRMGMPLRRDEEPQRQMVEQVAAVRIPRVSLPPQFPPIW